MILPPGTKSIICENCLAVILVTSALDGSTSSKPATDSPHPAVPYSEDTSSLSSHPHSTLPSSVSLPLPNQLHSPFHHHDPIPIQHPLAQFRSASLSRTQVPQQPRSQQPSFQHQSSFKTGPVTDQSMLNLPPILVLEPKPIKDPSLLQYSQSKPLEEQPSPLYPSQTSPSPNARRPPKHAIPLPTQGVQLYRQNSRQNPLQYSPKPFHAQGSKRAVICGISYRGTSLELKGCLNDAKCMSYLLTSKYNFPESAILMLTGITSPLLFF